MIAKPPLTARPGWFSDENKWKTTPAASASVAARNFIDDAATPPCGDARRGIAALLQLIHSFYDSTYSSMWHSSQFVHTSSGGGQRTVMATCDRIHPGWP